MNTLSKMHRVVAISLCTSGFGYVVLEGENGLVDYGNRGAKEPKNESALTAVEQVLAYSRPRVLVLPDVNAKGTRRAQRIKELDRDVLALARRLKIRVVKISDKKLRTTLLGRENGTKHEIAELMARSFPDDLAHRLPPKRKPWKSQDRRMNYFDAVALAVAFLEQRGSSLGHV